VSSPRETTAGEELTALDSVGAVIAGLGAVFCFLFPVFVGPRIQKISADFGGELPAITQLVLTLWFPLLLWLTPTSLIVLALVLRTSSGVRRGLLVGALVLSLSSSGFCLYAMDAPRSAAAEMLDALDGVGQHPRR
jgi:hypothetical protein